MSLGTGSVLGLVGPVAAKWDNPFCVALSLVFSGGWSWACYAFLVGYLRPSKIESVLLSALGLAVGVITYYVFKDLSPAAPVGMEYGASGQGVSSRIIVWGTAAFVLGAPVGLVGNLARMPDFRGLPFRLVVPVMAFVETSMRLVAEADGQSATVVMVWHATRILAGAVGLALTGQAIRNRWNARRARPGPEGHVEHSGRERAARP